MSDNAGDPRIGEHPDIRGRQRQIGGMVVVNHQS